MYPVIQKYSQLGNAALKHNPYQAEKYYRQLIKTAQGTNFPWQGKLHAKIDIVMSMVLDYVKPDCRHHEANEILKYIEQYIAEAEQDQLLIIFDILLLQTYLPTALTYVQYKKFLDMQALQPLKSILK